MKKKIAIIGAGLGGLTFGAFAAKEGHQVHIFDKNHAPGGVVALLEHEGYKVGLIGTNQNMIGHRVLEADRTTPESFELYGLLAEMRDAGCRWLVMEVSSHALALNKIDAIRFDLGVFTFGCPYYYAP